MKKSLFILFSIFLGLSVNAQVDSTCASVGVVIQTSSFGFEVDWDITDEFGNLIYDNTDSYISNSAYTYSLCLEDGCYYLNMYDSFGDGWNGGAYYITTNQQTFSGTLLGGQLGTHVFSIGTSSCDSLLIYGCTDPNAYNYNASAQIDDGSCYIAIYGCMDSLALNYDPSANVQASNWCQYADSLCIVSFNTNGPYYNPNTGPTVYFNIDNYSQYNTYFIDYGDGTSEVLDSNFWYPQHEYTVPGSYLACLTVTNDFCTDTFCDSIFIEEMIYGCTDSAAFNYNPLATINDGSCTLCDSSAVSTNIYVCVFQNGANVGFQITSDAGDVVYSQMGYNNNAIANFEVCLEEGVCYTAEMFNLDSTETGWYNGYWWANVDGIEIIQESLNDDLGYESIVFSIDGTCGEVYGCTDSTASNYDASATIDDGSCYFPVLNDLCADATPLTEGTFVISNEGAYMNENIWGECWGWGSGEGEQTSIWYSFTTPDYPAHIVLESSGDGSYSLTDTQFGIFDACGGDMIYCDGNSGDGMFAMLDFDCGVLAENTTYLLMIDGWNADEGTALLSYSTDTLCGGNDVFGCTDPWADNYNPNATIDDGSCYYGSDSTCTALFAWTFGSNNPGLYTFLGDDNNPINSAYVWTITNSQGNSYTLTGQDVSYQFTEQGDYTICLTVSGSFCSDYHCTTITVQTVGIYGCTDPVATNFDPNATIDDGTCYYWQDSCDYNSVQLFMVTGSFGSEVSFDVTDDSGNVIIAGSGFQSNSTYFYETCLEDGCYTLNMNDSFGDGWNGGVIEVVYNGVSVAGQLTLPSGSYTSATFGINDTSCGDTLVLYGCTDPFASNYNPFATDDDGSCYYNNDTLCSAGFDLLTVNMDSSMVVLVNTSVGQSLNYYWDFGDGNTSSDAFPVHTYTQDGSYYVCLTVFDSLGWCQDTYCDTITFINGPVMGGGSGFNGFHINVVPPSVTSIDELGLSDQDVSLFPNPSADVMYVSLEQDAQESLTMQIFDLSGRLVHTERFNGTQATIDVREFSEGMYILSLAGQKGRLTKRFNVLR